MKKRCIRVILGLLVCMLLGSIPMEIHASEAKDEVQDTFKEWKNYSSKYYYNQLSDKQRSAWDALDELCYTYLTTTKDAEKGSFKISGSDKKTTVYHTTYIKETGLTKAEGQELVRLFWYSNPQYYFVSNLLLAGENYVGLSIYSAFADGDDREAATKEIQKQIDEWKVMLDACDGEQAKVRAIHDWIVEKSSHNDEVFEDGEITQQEEEEYFTQSAYSVLKKELALSGGYAETMQLMCEVAGIDAVCVTSTSHQWNKVRINESWYNIDAQRADQDGGIYYGYYTRSDKIYKRDGDSYKEEAFWKNMSPPCTLDADVYDFKEPGTLPLITETAEKPTISATQEKDGIRVTITSKTEKARIYYTLDGTTPTSGQSKAYAYKDSFLLPKKTKVRAIAVCDGMWDSSASTKTVIPTKFTITYKLNGGTNHKKNPSTFTFTSEITLNAPTRTGCVFKGWYTDSKYKNKIEKIAKGTVQNITLYAKWTANKYDINFSGNGATSGTMTSLAKCSYTKTYALPKNAFKKKGYKFVGWNTKANGTGTTYANEASVKGLVSKDKGSITLYAQWQKNTYKITYVLNGGKNHKDNPSQYTVSTKTITLKSPTRKGYTFKGWYTDAKFKTKVTEIKKGSTGAKTLYAKWQAKKYTISFNGNGATKGKMENFANLSYGKTYTLTANTFTKKGYTFIGWNTKKNGTGTSYADKASIKNLTSKNGEVIVLYAQWKKAK